MAQSLNLLCIGEGGSDLDAIDEYASILGWQNRWVVTGREADEALRSGQVDAVVLLCKTCEDDPAPDPSQVRWVERLRAAWPVVLTGPMRSPHVADEADRLAIEVLPSRDLLLSTFKRAVIRAAERFRCKCHEPDACACT